MIRSLIDQSRQCKSVMKASSGAIMRKARLAAQCKSGLAATEFAMILPIMIFLFFGLVEGADALTANRRVSISVNTMADLVAQATQIEASDADDLFTGVERMLEPTSGIAVDFRLMSIILVDGDPVIHWSIDNEGNEPYAVGSTYTGLEDNTVLDGSASLIIVELNYPHQTSMVNRVFDQPIVFERRAARWPRQSGRIQFCITPGNCTT